jgi:peptide deformylase
MPDSFAIPTPDQIAKLRVILHPDSRLKKTSMPVTEDERGPALDALVAKMFELMRQHEGVGLAAPQVGVNKRLFVMNATGEPEDDQVYVNPELSDPDDAEEAEEGCLSLPDIRVKVLRPLIVTLNATRPDGTPVEKRAEAWVPRIWQHEIDHLDGVLLTNKMSAVEKIAHRKKLRELERDYAGGKQ